MAWPKGKKRGKKSAVPALVVKLSKAETTVQENPFAPSIKKLEDEITQLQAVIEAKRTILRWMETLK